MNMLFLENKFSIFEHSSLGEIPRGTLGNHYFNYIGLSKDYMIHKYFNCGVILLNIKKINEDKVFQEMLDLLDSKKNSGLWIRIL